MMLHSINLSDEKLFEAAVSKLWEALGDSFIAGENGRDNLREVVAKQIGFESYASYKESLSNQDYSVIPCLHSMPFLSNKDKHRVVVWYMVPEFFRDGSYAFSFGKDGNEEIQSIKSRIKLNQTHRPIAQFHIGDKLHDIEMSVCEKVFNWMQGENWSPNGEARTLISKMGLHHTSMSCGDMIQIGDRFFACKRFGFEEIKI